MMRGRIASLILLSAILLVWMPTHAQDETHVYAASDENFANPERGFYHQDAPFWIGGEQTLISADELRPLRDQGLSMLRFYFLLDEFIDRPISEEALAAINTQFAAIRTAGLKVIPRFAYNFPMSGEYPYRDPDAPLDQVLAHIDQLQPVLARNADVIAFMEVGFVGAWGEWHSSTNGLIDEETGINAASSTIVERLLDALPLSRMLALRYAPHKMQLYGDAPLDVQFAYTASPQARIGTHNDCFLASVDNWGTFPEDEAERTRVRAYLHAETRYLPQGGETCSDAADAQPLIQCENALEELAYFHYSTLNIDYHEGVMDSWRENGCFDEIARRLGYRLRLITATIPTNAAIGGSLSLEFVVQNQGFAAPYNPRLVEILLRSTSDGSIYRADVTAQSDPRGWLPDEGDHTVNITAGLSIPAGDYAVLLNLPDPMPSLYARPEYAIRLANESMWDASTGYHDLKAVITISADANAVPYEGSAFFHAD